jgi:hypothetical protein
MTTKPVERLYRVTFPSPDELRAWRVRVLEYAATAGGPAGGAPESRLVVFVPLLPRGHKSVHAYVSDGARGLVRDLSREADIGKAVSLRELPDGLTLIYGEGVDASAYEHRLRGE